LPSLGLFGNKQEKEAERAAAQAESDRLAGLSAKELAVEVMPAFGAEGPGKGGNEIGTLQVGIFLMKDRPRGSAYLKPLVDPIRESFQILENTGLIVEKVRGIGGSMVSVTRLGDEALENGSYKQLILGG
jgi:hypothetical protein